MTTLNGMNVAILAADGFELAELVEPRKALDQAGASTFIVSPANGEVQGWKHFDKADRFKVDVPLADADPNDFDALVLPGGVANPDQLRMLPEAVRFVLAFFDSDKPVAVICHGPWTLIDAGVARGRKLTSWPSLKADLTNAGAHWEDREVIVDEQLVSSRKPADLPAFNGRMLEVFAASRERAAAGAAPQGTRSTGPRAGDLRGGTH
jgi:protease I